MLIIDGYLVCYRKHKYFYMEDELRKAMATAYKNNGILVRAERDDISNKKYYCYCTQLKKQGQALIS